MLNMHTVTTRDISHHAARITEILEAGQTVAWTSRGRLIARITPVAKPADREQRNWLGRARQAGALNRSPVKVSDSVYEDRA